MENIRMEPTKDEKRPNGFVSKLEMFTFGDLEDRASIDDDISAVFHGVTEKYITKSELDDKDNPYCSRELLVLEQTAEKERTSERRSPRKKSCEQNSFEFQDDSNPYETDAIIEQINIDVNLDEQIEMYDPVFVRTRVNHGQSCSTDTVQVTKTVCGNETISDNELSDNVTHDEDAKGNPYSCNEIVEQNVNNFMNIFERFSTKNVSESSSKQNESNTNLEKSKQKKAVTNSDECVELIDVEKHEKRGLKSTRSKINTRELLGANGSLGAKLVRGLRNKFGPKNSKGPKSRSGDLNGDGAAKQQRRLGDVQILDTGESSKSYEEFETRNSNHQGQNDLLETAISATLGSLDALPLSELVSDNDRITPYEASFLSLKSPSKPRRGRKRSKKEVKTPHPAVESTQIYQCYKCDKSFLSYSQYQAHLKDHVGRDEFKCRICHNSYSKLKDLRSHMRAHIGQNTYACFVCDKRFQHSWELSMHSKGHSGEGAIDSSSLLKHAVCSIDDKKYNCDKCGKGFNILGLYNDHMLVHAINKNTKRFLEGNLRCRFCDEDVNDTGALKEHVLRHQNLNRCHQCCQEFACKMKLQVHVRKVHGGRFKCRECSLPFRHANKYAEHCKVGHDIDNPFVCEFCDREFGNHFCLRRHMARHTDDRYLNCLFCYAAYPNYHCLQLHMHKNHVKLKESRDDGSVSDVVHLEDGVQATNSDVFKAQTSQDRTDVTSQEISESETNSADIFRSELVIDTNESDDSIVML